MTNVLFIALEFAPVQTTGAFRSIEFARYLPEHGIQPHVVTIEPERGARIFSVGRNDALLSDLPVSISHLHDTSSSDPKRETDFRRFLRLYLRFDDQFYGRFKTSLLETLERLKREKEFAAVYASAPPFGATNLATLAASILKRPLVVDMRDAWSEWGFAKNPTFLHYLAKKRDERGAFERASAVVTVTERLANMFRASHPHLPYDRFAVVPNGFDGPPFEPQYVAGCAAGQTFDIAYVGSFYFVPEQADRRSRPHHVLQYRSSKEDWSYRGPQYFFAAWRALMRVQPDIAKRIRFHHIGATPGFLLPMAAEYGLSDYCRTWGIIPKQEVVETLSRMHAMLATSMRRPDGGDYCLASKTFDYLMAKKPILAFVCEGSQRDFLERAGTAVFCDPDDAAAAGETMRLLVTKGIRLRLSSAYVNQFHRSETARRMAAVMLRVTGTQPVQASFADDRLDLPVTYI